MQILFVTICSHTVLLQLIFHTGPVQIKEAKLQYIYIIQLQTDI